MKHVMIAEKSLLISDDAADCLLEYARLLAKNDTTDTVTVRAISADGNTVDVAFLLNAATAMVVESTNSTMEPPPNAEAVRYMQERIDRIMHPPTARPESAGDDRDYDTLNLR